MDNRRFKKAEDYYQRGCYTEALSIFSALNQIDESNDCLNYMGCCNLYLGNYQIAKSLLEYLSQKSRIGIGPYLILEEFIQNWVIRLWP